MKKKILILENIHQSGIDILKKKFQVIKKLGKSRLDQLRLIKNFDSVVVKSTIIIDQEFINHAKKLKIVARAGTGLDNIDLKCCKKKKIKVINTPSLNSDAVADFTLMQILCLVRNAYKAQVMISKNDFRRDLLLGRDMRSLKVGIVGFGNVGKKVAKRLRSFGSRIYILEKKKINKKFKKIQSLEKLIQISDVITFHVPLNSGTLKMLGIKELKKIKNKKFIINTSRASIIDSKSILNFTKQVNYATDVLDKEPPLDIKPKFTKYNNNLLKKKNIIITPHMAASTQDTQKKISMFLSKKLISSL
jgi:D-3-phosphoglycerate dehydrogenase / 2-oxoglutarate reductase